MKSYVPYQKEMDKTLAYAPYLEISNSLRQIMKYQLDMEYYMNILQDKGAKALMCEGFCNEIENALTQVISQMQHLDRETRDYITAQERYYYGESGMENPV